MNDSASGSPYGIGQGISFCRLGTAQDVGHDVFPILRPPNAYEDAADFGSAGISDYRVQSFLSGGRPFKFQPARADREVKRIADNEKFFDSARGPSQYLTHDIA